MFRHVAVACVCVCVRTDFSRLVVVGRTSVFPSEVFIISGAKSGNVCHIAACCGSTLLR